MSVFFANPLGLWALLAVPAILLIHFLQRESSRYEVTTLFLLDVLEKQSAKGRRFDRLRQSIPLWLQLLAVLLLTWLLVEPRWTSSRGAQRVVIVLDDSASMVAFRDELGASLARELPRFSRMAGTTEFTLLESSATGRTLFRGNSPEQLIAMVGEWNPTAGAHEPEMALRAGRGLAGEGGVLIFATDHPGNRLPYGAVRLAVGTKIDNVGFTGASVEVSDAVRSWKVSLKNHATTFQTRSWFIVSGASRTESREIELGPGATRTLEGQFPDEDTGISLLLEPDRFRADDRIDLLVPSSKVLEVSGSGASSLEPLMSGLIGSIDSISTASPGIEPDLRFSGYDPLSPTEIPPVSVVFSHQEQVPRIFFSGVISASRHPLVADLDWQGLIARSTPSLPLTESDLPLLWQGDRVMIMLRKNKGIRQLIFNFDVVTSNAPRLPAFVVLIHRFVNLIRSEKISMEQGNVEWHQLLRLAHESAPGAPPLEFRIGNQSRSVPLNRARFLRAPDSSGTFEISQGDNLLFRGCSNFADVREADFSQAGAVSEIGDLPRQLREGQTGDDPWRPLWVFLVGAATVLSWTFPGKPGGGPTRATGQQEAGIP